MSEDSAAGFARIPTDVIDVSFAFLQIRDVLNASTASHRVRRQVLASRQSDRLWEAEAEVCRGKTPTVHLQVANEARNVCESIARDGSAELAVAFTSSEEFSCFQKDKAYIITLETTEESDWELHIGWQFSYLNVKIINPENNCDVTSQLPPQFYPEAAALRVEHISNELSVIVEGFDSELRFVVLAVEDEKTALAWGLRAKHFCRVFETQKKIPYEGVESRGTLPFTRPQAQFVLSSSP